MTYVEAKARVMEYLSEDEKAHVKRVEVELGRPLMAWEVPNLFSSKPAYREKIADSKSWSDFGNEVKCEIVE